MRNLKTYLSFLISFTLTTLGLSAQQWVVKPDLNLLIWDNKPAKEWMTEAYPLGNGSLGLMVFGGTSAEHIQFNESTLWTGDEKETGAYQPFGDLFINFTGLADTSAGNYKRQLNLNNGVYNNNFRSGAIDYHREYFVSYPAKVAVLHYSASKPGALSGTIRLVDAHGAKTNGSNTGLNFSGTLPNGLQYASNLMIEHHGGTLSTTKATTGEQVITISGATDITILLAASTDYINQRKLRWHQGNPLIKNNERLTAAGKQTFAQLKGSHVNDYQRLFGRVKLDIGQVPGAIGVTTRERILKSKEKADPGLEALIFQFGRYLLISSSRPGGVPANLQGIWNDSPNPPWRSDYHSNINVQMNYWPGEPTNLSECQVPYLDYINSMREVKKESTREEYPGVRGWTVRTENNIFGGSSFNWNTPGSAWYAQALWEHYAFSRDKKFLKNFAYPILKEIVEFWDDHLKRRDDGTLVSPNGWSPEHGPTEDGVTYDQEIVYDLFSNYIQAADSLGVDASYRQHVADMRTHLLKPRIGKWGQLQEWETDRDDPKDQHRHASHLFALYPGRQISTLGTPAMAEAAKITLNARGDASTGWSMAWKASFWARLQDGDRSLRILKNFITLAGSANVNYNDGGGIYANLLCAHPPFQIDGNFGYTAAVAEMLLQSHTEYIQLLPALPKEWNKGSVNGLCARGAFELPSMSWNQGKITKVSILSRKGGVCRVWSATRLSAANAVLKETKKDSAFQYEFATQAGKTYQLIAK